MRRFQGRNANQPGAAASGGDPRAPEGSPPESGLPEPFASGGQEDVDLRGHETADQIIAHWLTDQANPQPGSTAQTEGPQAVRRAQAVAERAVNDSAVQKRYHKAIKRYFGRLPETIQNAAHDSSPAPSPPTTAPGSK